MGGNKANVYERIVAEIRRMIELGALRNGEKLPSVRTFAMERKVNPNTVAKAYAMLEEEGYIRVLLKKGAYVEYQRLSQSGISREIRSRIEELKESGITREDVERVLREVYGEGAEI